MNVFGATRSSVRRDHALITPDSFVRSPLPGWDRTDGVILIGPALGARFTQYLASMEAGAVAGAAFGGMERVVYVLEGAIEIEERTLQAGGFAYLPAGADVRLRAAAPSRLNVFEKPYAALPGAPLPRLLLGQEQDIQGEPFLGDPDALLKTLLPVESSFDLAVNVFTFRPGAALPLVEVHVMEHGLLMLAGQGVYRLADEWYPVRQGDVIWMAPFCPQWFVAMGKEPARYVYYKDVHRDPWQGRS
jgi:(S)-ureidoglycine aminohydrolase